MAIRFASYEEVRDRDSLLHAIKWRRVVLDEGHKIKNRDSKTMVAICELQREASLVVTATPIVDRPAELFSYLQFIKMPHAHKQKFRKKYNPKGEKSGARLSLLLKKFMLRRTKATSYLGLPICSLPPFKDSTMKVKMTPIHALLYYTYLYYFLDALNKYLLEKNSSESEGATMEDNAEG
jgi:SWI/SNF-related matrix-associated actin-dependent regulator of chromatin subfamily A3